jgi:hypothetical protein
LGAEPQAEHGPGRVGVGADGDGHGGGGLGDGVAQERGGEPGRGWLVVVAGGVEADDGVEVDYSPGLVFGDFDVPDPYQGAEPLLGEPGEAGEVAGHLRS